MSHFFDSNVLVYALDATQGMRHAVADALLEEHLTRRSLVISTQVLQETYAVLTRKKRLPPQAVSEALAVFRRERVVPADADSVLRAFALAQRHQLSCWDALIVQAALDARCTTLLTEDLQAGMRFGELEVVNPFSQTVQEPPGAYTVPRTKAARARRG